jgi:hypothetical protein
LIYDYLLGKNTMATLDPAIDAAIQAIETDMARWRDSIRRHGDATGALGSAISQATRQISKLNQAGVVATQFTDLSKSVKQQNFSALEAAHELRKLDKAAQESGIALTRESAIKRDQIISSIRQGMATKSVADGFQVLATTTGGFVVNSLKDFAQALTNSSGAAGYFSLGTKMMKNDIAAISEASAGFASVMKDLATTAAIIMPHPGAKLLAGIVAGIAGLAEAGIAKSKELSEFAVDILNDQVQKMVVAFQSYSKGGAVFVNGLTDMGTLADQSGITIKELAGLIASTSEQMALFGGTVAGGAKRLASVNENFKAMDASGRSFRSQLGNLGMSIEDQMSVTNEYLEMLSRSGKLRSKSDADVAKETFEYAKSLKVIQAITGEDAKAAQRRSKAALDQSYVQAKMAQMGPDAMKKFRVAVEGMDPALQKAVQQIAADGQVTDPETAAILEQTPALRDMLYSLAEGIKDQSKGVTQFTDDYTKMSAEIGPIIREQALAASDGVGRANLLLGKFSAMEPVLQAALKMGARAAAAPEEQKGARAAVEGAARTTDVLTESIGNAETKFSEMSRTLERNLTPAMEQFAKFVEAQIDITSKVVNEALQKLNIGSSGPTATVETMPGGTATVTPGGAVMYPQRKPSRLPENPTALPPTDQHSAVDSNASFTKQAQDQIDLNKAMQAKVDAESTSTLLKVQVNQSEMLLSKMDDLIRANNRLADALA